jgi:hypothetical protein
MGIRDLLLRLNRQLEEVNNSTKAWAEEARIRCQAEEHLKTDNFASELERRIHKEVAERERLRRQELARILAADPALAKFFHESKERGRQVASSKSIVNERISDEVALKSARRRLEIERELAADPELREIYERLSKGRSHEPS